MRLFQKLSQFFKRLSTAWRGTPMKEEVQLINLDKAWKYAEAIEDSRLRRVMGVAVSAVLFRYAREMNADTETYYARIPDCSFDVLFYAKTVHELLSDERVKAFMQGQEDKDFWPD